MQHRSFIAMAAVSAMVAIAVPVSNAMAAKTASILALTLPDTSGNFFSADGSIEYAASGKSYATVAPGCAVSPKTGQPTPFVNLFDNGNFLLNVSVNGVPLTQLNARKPQTPVFLLAGLNVISAANMNLSTDYYIRSGGNGHCVLAY